MSSSNCKAQKHNVSPDPVIFTTTLLTNWISDWYELTSLTCMCNKPNSTVKHSCSQKVKKDPYIWKRSRERLLLPALRR